MWAESRADEFSSDTDHKNGGWILLFVCLFSNVCVCVDIYICASNHWRPPADDGSVDPDDLIGRDVWVFWDGDEVWFKGVVISYAPTKKQHTVRLHTHTHTHTQTDTDTDTHKHMHKHKHKHNTCVVYVCFDLCCASREWTGAVLHR